MNIGDDPRNQPPREFECNECGYVTCCKDDRDDHTCPDPDEA